MQPNLAPDGQVSSSPARMQTGCHSDTVSCCNTPRTQVASAAMALKSPRRGQVRSSYTAAVAVVAALDGQTLSLLAAADSEGCLLRRGGCWLEAATSAACAFCLRSHGCIAGPNHIEQADDRQPHVLHHTISLSAPPLSCFPSTWGHGDLRRRKMACHLQPTWCVARRCQMRSMHGHRDRVRATELAATAPGAV